MSIPITDPLANGDEHSAACGLPDSDWIMDPPPPSQNQTAISFQNGKYLCSGGPPNVTRRLT